jgi:hypothetical protein
MPIIVILGLIAAWYFGLFESFQGHTYRAEVGYFQGSERTWYVGRDKSREACTAEATALYNSYNRESPGRAFSWACRKMQGDRFLDRVR